MVYFTKTIPFPKIDMVNNQNIINGDSMEIDEKIAEFIGFFIGDGFAGKYKRVRMIFCRNIWSFKF